MGKRAELLASLATILLVFAAPASAFPAEPAKWRVDINNGCLGVFNISLFAKLDRFCEDCYYLFDGVKILTRCK